MKTGFPICSLIPRMRHFLKICGLSVCSRKTWTANDDPRIDINHDGAAMQAIRMLESMIEAENENAVRAAD